MDNSEDWMKCEVDGCSRRKRRWTARYCEAHLKRAERSLTGDPGPARIRSRRKD
jgi:hypothetical protein